MSEISQESPLLGSFSRGQKTGNGSPGVTIIERPFLGYVNLRGDVNDASFVDAVDRVLGVALPSSPNSLVETDDRTVCWMGPDEWLAIVRPGAEAEITTALRESVAGFHASVTDITGGYTMLNLAGRHARDLLAKGCTLDLHPRAFAPGQCVQTNLAKTAILLVSRNNDPDLQSFDVVVRRSFADYLAHWIEHSAREYGLAIGVGEV